MDFSRRMSLWRGHWSWNKLDKNLFCFWKSVPRSASLWSFDSPTSDLLVWFGSKKASPRFLFRGNIAQSFWATRSEHVEQFLRNQNSHPLILCQQMWHPLCKYILQVKIIMYDSFHSYPWEAKPWPYFWYADIRIFFQSPCLPRDKFAASRQLLYGRASSHLLLLISSPLKLWTHLQVMRWETQDSVNMWQICVNFDTTVSEFEPRENVETNLFLYWFHFLNTHKDIM